LFEVIKEKSQSQCTSPFLNTIPILMNNQHPKEEKPDDDSTDELSVERDTVSEYKPSQQTEDKENENKRCPREMSVKTDKLETEHSLSYSNKDLGHGRRLYKAYDGSGKPVSVAAWAKWMSEVTHRGNQARFITIEMMKVRKKECKDGLTSLLNLSQHTHYWTISLPHHKTVPFQAMMFETKGMTFDASHSEQFSFVLIESQELHDFGEMGADINSFASHFQGVNEPEEKGVAFKNLGRDALLIAPLPPVNQRFQPYSHLAKFVREADSCQIDGFFVKLALEFKNHLKLVSPQPVWLSTSGLGVAWLHFRLDSSPKYYMYRPFTKSAVHRNRQRGPVESSLVQWLAPTSPTAHSVSSTSTDNGIEAAMDAHQLRRIQKKTRGGRTMRRKCSCQGCHTKTYLICQNPACIAKAKKKTRQGMFICRKHHKSHALLCQRVA
jgi:hypothetical protein